MSAHPYADLLKVADADAALLDPDVARLRGLVTAMPPELCVDDDLANAGTGEPTSTASSTASSTAGEGR